MQITTYFSGYLRSLLLLLLDTDAALTIPCQLMHLGRG